ncbi:MAG: hydrogenase nickel incorporation protein HypB [Proteobacteria bacterium]|nr:hydrogenase nickel incorporation protein HypB [Pseudomonadota bacterium]
MCGVCGCGEGEARLDGRALAQARIPGEHGGHGHHHHAHGQGHGRRALVEIEQDILSKNDADAATNRARFGERGILALNLVSSPGAGKTTLLTATIETLKGSLPVAVIEGDQETANDADRIRAAGARAVQINTGRGCHLDAHTVGHAFDSLAPEIGTVLFIENVGNLVCPAAFDLGEDHKVAILSVAEGEDKPLKYPDMFAAAELMVLNKIDLLPYVEFDPDRAIEYARRVNPQIAVIRLSARTGEGMPAWLDWIRQASERALRARTASVA